MFSYSQVSVRKFSLNSNRQPYEKFLRMCNFWVSFFPSVGAVGILGAIFENCLKPIPSQHAVILTITYNNCLLFNASIANGKEN